MKRALLIAGAIIAVAVIGCGGESSPAVGDEGGECYANGTCNGALACLSDLCVSLTDSTDAATTDGSSVGDASWIVDAAGTIDAIVIDGAPSVEILFPEPPGAPSSVADGRLTCLGNNDPDPPFGSAIELTGWVRTFADPQALAPPPAALVEAFDPGGTSLGSALADVGSDGRVAVGVPIEPEGFVGYARITHAGYVDYRFETSRAVTNTGSAGWAWLLTPAELSSWATTLGVSPVAGTGTVIGSVHDCDAFGIGAAVVQLDASSEDVFYTVGFEPRSSETYTDASGRFVVPNVMPGPTVVKAYGRLTAGGPLVLLSSIETVVAAGEVTAVGLQPRVGFD